LRFRALFNLASAPSRPELEILTISGEDLDPNIDGEASQEFLTLNQVLCRLEKDGNFPKVNA